MFNYSEWTAYVTVRLCNLFANTAFSLLICKDGWVSKWALWTARVAMHSLSALKGGNLSM